MPELSRKRRLLVLGVCCSSLFIVGLDATIVNIALPSIQHDLHAPVSGLQWTVDAYTLVVASFLILAGSTGDRVGRRRTFQVGLATFTLGSLLCSLAPSLGWLVAFRAMQAIGGSMLNPVALSIIANTFTDNRERARAFGVWGAVFGLSMALGPVVGGVLVATVGWRGIFWVNIPVGIAAIVATALAVPESRAAHGRRVDPVGQVLIIVMLASLTYAIIEGPRHGWSSGIILGLFGLAAAAAAGLAIYEPRREEPLLDLRFFRSAPFTGAVVIAITAFSALAGFLFLNTLYLQDARHLSALHAGLYTLPMAAMTVLLAPLSGRITGQRGPRIPLLVAGVMTTAGALLMSGFTATTPVPWLMLAYVVLGIGNGMVNPPISNTAVSGMPRSQAGVAAAVASTSRQVGGSLGVALTGSAVASALHGSLRTGFVPASHAGWLIVAGCGVLVLVAGVASSGRWARGTAERTAGLLISEEPAVPAAAPGPPRPGLACAVTWTVSRGSSWSVGYSVRCSPSLPAHENSSEAAHHGGVTAPDTPKAADLRRTRNGFLRCSRLPVALILDAPEAVPCRPLETFLAKTAQRLPDSGPRVRYARRTRSGVMLTVTPAQHAPQADHARPTSTGARRHCGALPVKPAQRLPDLGPAVGCPRRALMGIPRSGLLPRTLFHGTARGGQLKVTHESTHFL